MIIIQAAQKPQHELTYNHEKIANLFGFS